MPSYPQLMIPLRWPFYTFVIVASLFQTFIALNTSNDTTNSLPPFSTTCAIIAIFTLLWVAILLCFGGSETEYEHPLTWCSTHIASFAVIAVVWFVLGICIAVRAAIGCHRHPSVCMPLRFATILAFLIFISSCLCAAIVICPIAIARVGCHIHVEHARERAKESPIERARQQHEYADAPMHQMQARRHISLSRPLPAYIL